jgi:hypothetical protein
MAPGSAIKAGIFCSLISYYSCLGANGAGSLIFNGPRAIFRTDRKKLKVMSTIFSDGSTIEWFTRSNYLGGGGSTFWASLVSVLITLES